MIPLKCIVEYAILQGQSYDIGQDFANFQRAVDGTTDRVKQQFEQSINSKLKGKRVRARSSRGYKQFEKDYEFDVSNTTIDDYYDNFVVVAHDTSGKKPKDYFLKPGSKIQIIGLASGHPSPTTTPDEPQGQLPSVVASPEEPKPKKAIPMKEDQKFHDVYSINNITDDIKRWVRVLMKDPRIGARNFVKTVGLKKVLPDGRLVAVFNLTLPFEQMKRKLTSGVIQALLNKVSSPGVRFEVKKFEPDENSYNIHIKKTVEKVNPAKRV